MELQLVSIIALGGWLILALSAYRSYRMSGRKTLTYLLIWSSIFLLVILLFSAVAG